MVTGPNLKREESLVNLSQEGFKEVIADGQLSSGQPYEIRFSGKSAVTEGIHLIITFPGASELNAEEQTECFAVMNGFAREQPLAQQFGYRYDQNFGAMLTRPQPHAHVIIPGSLAERARAPRIVDAWPEKE